MLLIPTHKLRNYASCVHAMGTRALRSPHHWGNKVDRWRKKKSYQAVTRNLNNSPKGYKQWDCFVFRDYVERQAAARTYEVRHLPLSDGNDFKNFGGKMKFDWAKYSWSPARTKSRAEPLVKKEPINACDAAQEGVPMIFDVELGKLVPIE